MCSTLQVFSLLSTLNLQSSEVNKLHHSVTYQSAWVSAWNIKFVFPARPRPGLSVNIFMQAQLLLPLESEGDHQVLQLPPLGSQGAPDPSQESPSLLSW